jgi:hypothetical protein
MDKRCVACGGQLEPGVIETQKPTLTRGMFDLASHLTFVRRGEPPPKSFVEAVRQAWREGGRRRLPLEAFRCVGCGRVELYTGEGVTSGT